MWPPEAVWRGRGDRIDAFRLLQSRRAFPCDHVAMSPAARVRSDGESASRLEELRSMIPLPSKCLVCGVDRVRWVAFCTFAEMAPLPGCKHNPPCRPKPPRTMIGLGMCAACGRDGGTDRVTPEAVAAAIDWTMLERGCAAADVPAPDRTTLRLEWETMASWAGAARG